MFEHLCINHLEAKSTKLRTIKEPNRGEGIEQIGPMSANVLFGTKHKKPIISGGRLDHNQGRIRAIFEGGFKH